MLKRSLTHGASLLKIVERYRASGCEWPATARDLAVFAINSGHWQPHPSKLVSLCAREIARALREEKHIDHLERAFQQRRMRLVRGCLQLKTDVDSFNDNRDPERPIQMVFDFRKDLEELEQPGDYPPRQPR